MAFATVQSWSETPASNTEIDGVNIDEGCNPSGINNAIRELMAQVAAWTGDDTIASATTTDLSTVNGQYVAISGTTTITGLGTVKAGWVKFLKFDGALTLTHNATSLILPGAANKTTAAGDTAVFASLGSGNWRLIAYQDAAGFYASVGDTNTWTAIQTFKATDNVTTTYPLVITNSSGTQTTSFGAYGMAMSAGTRAYTILAHDNLTTTYPIKFSNAAGTQTTELGAYGLSASGDYTITVGGELILAGGEFLVPDGTASLPSIANSSNTDTGIYFSGGGLRFTHDGADVASVGSTGITINTTPGSGTFGVNDAVKNLINSGGQIDVTNTQSGSCLRLSRTTNGQIQQFYQSTTQVGNISVTGSATAYNTSSDGRLKENFGDFDAGSIIDAIEVYEYNWIADGSVGYGPVAQELHAVFPQAVQRGSVGDRPGDETFEAWTYDASKLVPVLIKEIQSMRARLNAAGL